MPFKTKKKKQHASKNRISLNDSGTLTYTNTLSAGDHAQHQSPRLVREVDTIGGNDHVQMKKELARIFLLSSLIIGLQLALKASNLPLFR